MYVEPCIYKFKSYRFTNHKGIIMKMQIINSTQELKLKDTNGRKTGNQKARKTELQAKQEQKNTKDEHLSSPHHCLTASALFHC